ncbi:glycosyltransferase [Nitrosospira sp. NRS527]|uniref:glycosyltransferase n=1 Tax=Nitrosospira sp. NRS527 TaxID=155925 RepID=UPI001AFB7BCB|nr:glycosyltransferase [Nitrosospira sp. NRS527]BCT68964.1 hypothetical protein NNRS527_02575 [Nitrosospira sp. NRS527]
MKSEILTSVYIADTKRGIWSRPEYMGIAYSDGDEVEDRIAEIIDQTTDITVLSAELRQHCIDWPSLYHLSGTRANILRPFDAALRGDILEIGSGCGAITRYLGESGANVLALEGSPRRAAITRSRTRDLENVTVLAEKLDQFQSNCRFDVITLIGVLEYANLFMASENAAFAMLQHVRTLLKPQGQLIIAIENQLGLKYFAGAPEDHLGQPMYGIEGRYAANQPQTFGRAVLAGLLEKAGFAVAKFLAPFPDYKLPISILTTEGLSSQRFDGAALAWQSVRRDPQLPSSTNFSLELTWPEIFKNGLALDMANSFLIVASVLQQQIVKSGILGYHYSTDRAPPYCKETVFEQTDRNMITVNYHNLVNREQDNRTNQIISFTGVEKAPYAEGEPLWFEFVKIVTCDGWSFEEVGLFIQRYVNLLAVIANQKGYSIGKLQLADKLPGDFFDMTPQNIIVNHTGQPHAIDPEWALADDVEVGLLLFRSLLWGTGSACFGKHSTGDLLSRRTFIKLALAAAGYSLTGDDFMRFTELESIIQQQVTGRSSREFLNRWLEQPLLTSVTRRDEQLASLSHIIAKRDEQIAKLQHEIVEIHESTSWRLTSPIREIKSALMPLSKNLTLLRSARFTRSLWFNKLLRQTYKDLPLPWHIKQRLKEIYLRRPGAWKVNHKDVFQLDKSRDALPLVAASAKQFDPTDPWVLVIDLRIPTPDQDSGSVRMYAILRLLVEMGFRITFVSDSEEHLPHYREALEKQGIGILYGSGAAHKHLAAVGGKYHFVLLSRPETAFRYLPHVRAYALYSQVIYDTVDLHWVRFEREMLISGDRALVDAIASFRHIELFNCTCADLVLAITDDEKDHLLAEQPDAKVTVLPNIHEIFFPKTPFAQRRGILFIGGFWHKPNEDAVIFFVRNIFPRIRERIPDVVFYIIGSNMPSSVESLRSANVAPLGFVPDAAPYFESCRIFVAPLRFGAGMKGKVGHSISYGLPIVATRIGAEGMGLRHEKHLLIADDPDDFADLVVRLYNDETLWYRLSTAALTHLDTNYSLAAARKRMIEIFPKTRNASNRDECRDDSTIIPGCSTSSTATQAPYV